MTRPARTPMTWLTHSEEPLHVGTEKVESGRARLRPRPRPFASADLSRRCQDSSITPASFGLGCSQLQSACCDSQVVKVSHFRSNPVRPTPGALPALLPVGFLASPPVPGVHFIGHRAPQATWGCVGSSHAVLGTVSGSATSG
jgi:hypothetical protein